MLVMEEMEVEREQAVLLELVLETEEAVERSEI